MKNFKILLILLAFTSCHIRNKTANSVDNIIIPIEYQNFELTQRDDVLIFTHQNEYTSKYPEPILKLVIIDSKTNDEIFNDELKNGKLEWINENILKINYTPGNPEKGKTYAYYFNLKTKSYSSTPYQSK